MSLQFDTIEQLKQVFKEQEEQDPQAKKELIKIKNKYFYRTTD